MSGTRSNIYYRRAEDISIEFSPTFNGHRANDIALHSLMAPTIGTWQITDWTKPDNRHNDSLWFDHSVATWMSTVTMFFAPTSTAQKLTVA
eukprot:5162514-Amphidinium_carterae.2